MKDGGGLVKPGGSGGRVVKPGGRVVKSGFAGGQVVKSGSSGDLRFKLDFNRKSGGDPGDK